MPINFTPKKAPLPHGSPTDGQLACAVTLKMNGGEVYNFDFSRYISRAESIYVDATQSSYGFQFDFDDTNRSLVVAQGCEICAPTFSGSQSVNITNLGSSVDVVRLLLFTCHKPYFERFPGSGILLPYGVAQPRGVLTQTTPYVNPGPYVPALGGTFDPQWAIAGADPSAVLSNGNLTATVSDSANATVAVLGQSYISTGKWYLEMVVPSSTTGRNRNGLGYNQAGQQPGQYNVSVSNYGGQISINGVTLINGFPVNNTPTNVNCFAIDMGAKRMWFRSDPVQAWTGNAVNVGDPVAGTNGLDISNAVGFSTVTNALTFFVSCFGSNYSGTVRTSTASQTGTVPSGYVGGWPFASV